MTALWDVVAQTDPRVVGFGPYVPCVDDAGRVAFTAVRADGSTELVSADPTGGACVSLPPEVAVLTSHPDGDGDGAYAVYAALRDGRTALVRAGVDRGILLSSGDVVDGRRIVSVGPTGPSMAAGRVAWRAVTDAGPAVLLHDGGRVRVVDVHPEIDGVPMVNREGTVAHRSGGPAVVRGSERLDGFEELGRFPCLAEDGSVAIAGRRSGQGWGWVRWRDGVDDLVAPGAWSFVRGGLSTARGRLALYVVPEGGALTIVSGPGGLDDAALSVGGSLFGGEVAEFALNPVSASETGWVAVRVSLTDGRGFILRSRRPIAPW